jgi:hypothetical protein
MKMRQSHEALISLLRDIPAQPSETRNPMAILRSLFAGTMTFEQALSTEVRAAMECCEELAWNRSTPGRNLCQRLNTVPPSPSDTVVAGW